MGDTHGDIPSIRQAVEQAALQVGPVDLWLHNGDFCRDAPVLTELAGIPVITVAGNCDGRAAAKPDEFVELAGFVLWLTHGHQHRVKQDLKELETWALRYEVNIVVYGHTHQALAETQSGILFFNPGSTAAPRRGKNRTFGVIELSSGPGGILPRLISLP
jgi:hypothetical protein